MEARASMIRELRMIECGSEVERQEYRAEELVLVVRLKRGSNRASVAVSQPFKDVAADRGPTTSASLHFL